MSDYFGALLRSAGALPGTGQPPARVGPTRATAADTAFEQVGEVEAPPAPSAGPAAAASSAVEPGRDAAPRANSTATETAAQSLPPPTRPATPSLPTRHREPAPTADAETTVHPLVHAALRWVRADASTGDEAPRARATGFPAQPGADAFAPPVATPSASPDDAPGPDARLQPAPSVAPASFIVATPGPTLDLALPRTAPVPMSQRRVDGGARSEPQPPAPPHIELSIGTIHVSVDAPPPPRPAAQTIAPAPRPPAPPRSAPRSALSRSRLPRF